MRHIALLACLGALHLAATPARLAEPGHEHEVTAGREEILIFRTSRTERVRGATAECRAAGFDSVAQDRYVLASMQTASGTSRVARSHVQEVGEFTACFGAAAAGKPIAMFARGHTGGLGWTGRGECTGMAAQPPDRRVLAFSCNLALEGLPAGYAGGWATSSSLQPSLGPDAPADAHVTGYLSTSIVVMRLWRQ